MKIHLNPNFNHCQEKVLIIGEEVNITIEGFDKLKLRLWCWSKGYYEEKDANSTEIWNIIKNCEVLE